MESSTAHRILWLSLHGSFLAALHLFAASGSLLILFLAGIRPPLSAISMLTVVICLIAYGTVHSLMHRFDSPVMLLDRLWMVGAIVPVALLMEALFLYPIRGFGMSFQDYLAGLTPQIHLQLAAYLLCLVFNLMFFRSQR